MSSTLSVFAFGCAFVAGGMVADHNPWGFAGWVVASVAFGAWSFRCPRTAVPS